jgi:outer membrane protein TolC
MNIEKLIERLRTESLYKDKATLEIMDLCIEAADALSTLWDENERLRDEVERQRRSADNRQHLYENAERAYIKVLTELEQTRAEITRLKHYEDKCHDCPIVCAKTEIVKAHEELEAVQAELERVKRERDAAVEDLHKLCPAWKWDGQKED